MSGQPGYSRNGSHARGFYQSQASTSNPDAGQYLGSAREMGPPAFDFPAPQPVEIEVISSRTLPSPSISSSVTWDNFSSTPTFGGFPEYGSNMSRPLPMDNQVRTSTANPLQQWYTGNDGPWIPRGLSDVPEERSQSRVRAGNRMPIQYGHPYRQPNQSDGASFPFGVPPSDSGYETRRSDGNASIFSGDINHRDQDCQSLASHVPDFPSFPGLNDLQQPDIRTNDGWIPISSSSPSDTPSLVCPTCQQQVKTRSELKKHDFRHKKPFICSHPGCPRKEGFSTTNDLERHVKSKHPSPGSEATKRFRCRVQGCKSKEKSWPRLDNFRSHLKRVHSQALSVDEDFEEMIRRAEYWGPPGNTTDQESLPLQSPSLLHPSRANGPVAHQDPSRTSSLESAWRQPYPEIIEPSQDLLDLKESPLEEPRTAVQGQNGPISDEQSHKTVQPVDIFRAPTEIRDNPPSLESILSPPVGVTESAAKKPEQPKPAPHTSKISPQGKTIRQNEMSASHATITEVIITALAGASTPEDSKDRALHGDLQPSNLPHGKSPAAGSWPSSPNSAIAAERQTNGHINCTNALPTQEDSRILQQKTAEEVLKTLLNNGYIVQKDPSHSPKPQNPGSAASSKSDKLVTCQTCSKFKGRPCELKKHMKRHSRPYGCTFLTCNKTFGSKNDWKRHENSQHFHLETWRCNEEKPGGGTCAKACYRRQTFQDHLKKEHDRSDEAIPAKVEACRIGRNCQARFWCGFCSKLVDLKKKGLEAWTERFDHIDDHFMGRHDLPKQGIQDWVPVDSDKPKGDMVETPHALDPSPGGESQEGASDSSASSSPNGSSSESSGAMGGSQALAINLDEDRQEAPKRKRSNSNLDDKPAKHPRLPTKKETVVYCCQCRAAHNPKIDQGCSLCDNSHAFCINCTRESRTIQEES